MQRVVTTNTNVDYVEDAYTDAESPFFKENEVSYTQTLRNSECRLEQVSMDLEEMACDLEALAALASKTSGIGANDREHISNALKNASSNVGKLREECDNSLFDVSAALRAFDGLQVPEGAVVRRSPAREQTSGDFHRAAASPADHEERISAMADEIKDAAEFDYPNAIEVFYGLMSKFECYEDATNDAMDALDATYAQVLTLAAAGKLDRCDLIEAHKDAACCLVAVHNAANQAGSAIQRLIGIVGECADKAPKFRKVI